ncbi:MAG: AAA family ATPase [Oscillospiraceae bacterium]|jgi:DNA transposition AAA+ family ATPase|nr:AAA family ATPase [Oscillospiraceae bacterium]
MKEFDQGLQQKVRDYIAENSMSQVTLGEKIGKSKGVISGYLKGKYIGAVPELEAILREYLNAEKQRSEDARQAMPFKPVGDYVPIRASEEVASLIEYAQINRTMVTVVGDPGVGKTRGAFRFCRDNPNSAVYVKVEPCFASVRGVLRMIARELHINDRQCAANLAWEIRERVDGTNMVMIVDEAQFLPHNAIEQLRGYVDQRDFRGSQGIGIVLIGNEKILQKVTGKNAQDHDCDQISNRNGMKHICRNAKISEKDVRLLFPLLAEQGAEKELALMHRICKSRNGVRGAAFVYNNAVHSKEKDISYEGLVRSAKATEIMLTGI